MLCKTGGGDGGRYRREEQLSILKMAADFSVSPPWNSFG